MVCHSAFSDFLGCEEQHKLPSQLPLPLLYIYEKGFTDWSFWGDHVCMTRKILVYVSVFLFLFFFFRLNYCSHRLSWSYILWLINSHKFDGFEMTTRSYIQWKVSRFDEPINYRAIMYPLPEIFGKFSFQINRYKIMLRGNISW